MNHLNSNQKIMGPTGGQDSSGGEDDEAPQKGIDVSKGLPKHNFGTSNVGGTGQGVEMSKNIQFGKFNTG